MSQVVGLYVRDQDEALAFYVGKLGFRVHTDVRNGDYRWLTVQHPEQPSFQLGLFAPGPPVHDAATAQTLRAIVAKGAMPPLVLSVADCRAAYERMRAKGVEFTQEPVEPLRQRGRGLSRPVGQRLEDDPGWALTTRAPGSRARDARALHGAMLPAHRLRRTPCSSPRSSSAIAATTPPAMPARSTTSSSLLRCRACLHRRR